MDPDLRALVEAMAPGGQHRYLSTYCLHALLAKTKFRADELHAECASTQIIRSGSCVPREPAQCKVGQEPCVCPCHEEVSTDG